MKIYFERIGYIKKYYVQEPDCLILEDGATLKDFCIKVNETAEGTSRHSIWNSEEKKFRGPVVASVDGKIVKDLNYKLEDGQRVRLLYSIVGG